ncbi:hypothetical protein mvi_35490 [Methylobacterium indicum]|uniref:Uncharacterized protein n=1 Tax=Methylobacterium indicum TaxID=1775910 RepID=A0A8H8WV96_9HYPH|nr:hypothetical protein mvi_35490 [Methylobacterium indicum]
MRTEARGAWPFERIVTTGSVMPSTVGGSEAGTAAAHRYPSSPCTDWDGIVQASAARTAQACAGRPIVAVRDTSVINVTPAAAGRHGLGPAGTGRNPGFVLHPVVAVEAEDEAVPGPVDARFWTRSTRPILPRHQRPVEEKESLHWITGARAAATALSDAAQSPIVIADREGDGDSHFARRPLRPPACGHGPSGARATTGRRSKTAACRARRDGRRRPRARWRCPTRAAVPHRQGDAARWAGRGGVPLHPGVSRAGLPEPAVRLRAGA